MDITSYVLIICLIKCSLLQEKLPNGLSEILEELIEHELETDNIKMNSTENKSKNGSTTYCIEDETQSTENAHNRNNINSNTEIDHIGDIYKVSDAKILDPKAHIEVTKIAEDNSIVIIEYAPKSIQYIIKPEKPIAKVVESSEDQYTQNVEMNPGKFTSKAILKNPEDTLNESNNIYVKTRKSGSDINMNILGLDEKLKQIILEVNNMKSLHENFEVPKAEIEIKTSSPIIDKSLKKPITYLPYNFILGNVYPMLPVNQVLPQVSYRKNFIIKSSLFPRRFNLMSNYKTGRTVLQRGIPKNTNLYSYHPNYIG